MEDLHLWNGGITHRPASVVRPRTAEEVARAVSERGDLPLSVRSGGHDWAGRAIRDGGLVLDLRDLDSVRIDPRQRIATVGGGATSAAVIRAAAEHGLTAAAGNVGTIGFTALSLGGGYGPLSGRHGLAVDNVVGARLVLANGRIVDVDESHEPELFWAIRGGGGNFGVVTELRVRLHPATPLVTGVLFFAWDGPEELLPRLASYLEAAPAELTVQIGVLGTPDGAPAIFAVPAWSGDPGAGSAEIDKFSALGTVTVSQVGPMGYGDLLALYEGFAPAGRHVAMRTRSFSTITPEVARALVRAGDTRTSPFSGITVHNLRGPATRVPVEATAFPARLPHFMAEIVSCWEPGMPGDHPAWARDVWTELEPVSLPGGYANVIGPDEKDQADAVYGPNTARLLDVKEAYDPGQVFSASPLPRRS